MQLPFLEPLSLHAGFSNIDIALKKWVRNPLQRLGLHFETVAPLVRLHKAKLRAATGPFCLRDQKTFYDSITL
jgi:hypothetical protein